MSRSLFSKHGSLGEEERIRRIGELICRGIMASPSLHAGTDNSLSIMAPPAGVLRVPVTGEERVLHYLGSVPAASPKEIRVFLRISRATLYRVLNRLLLAGRIACSGRGKNVEYRLTDSGGT